MKRTNIQIIQIEERKETQVKGTENIFNKIIEENFPNLKKDAYRSTRDMQNTKQAEV